MMFNLVVAHFPTLYFRIFYETQITEIYLVNSHVAQSTFVERDNYLYSMALECLKYVSFLFAELCLSNYVTWFSMVYDIYSHRYKSK